MPQRAQSFMTNSAMSFIKKPLSALSKPTLKITLSDSSKSRIYSTFDSITGTVTVTNPSKHHDVRFDNFDISLVGETKTFLDDTDRTAVHRFLRLAQPISSDALPHPRVLDAGTSKTIPFTFVVPQQLLPRACSHPVTNQNVRESHLLLPPSLDTEVTSKSGKKSKGILPSSESATITYSIRTRLTKSKTNASSKPTIVAESSKPVRIQPSIEESPPLDVAQENDEAGYRLRQEKTIRRSVLKLKGRRGTLTMQTQQPRSFRLPAPSSPNEDNAVTTHVLVHLRYDPAVRSNGKPYSPPKLSTLTTTLRATTSVAATPRNDFPHRSSGSPKATKSPMVGTVSTTTALSSLGIAGVSWQTHDPSTSPRPDSSLSTASSTIGTDKNFIPPPSKGYRPTSPFHTAHLLVPLSLPAKKSFAPTFHTCLVSRMYALHVSLSLAHKKRSASPNCAAMCKPLVLKVPVQVSSEWSDVGRERAQAVQMATGAAEDADAAWEPRMVGTVGAAWSDAGRGNDSSDDEDEDDEEGDEPPGYDVVRYASFAGRAVTYA